jgi:TP901 family phage tail tape measure protein
VTWNLSVEVRAQASSLLGALKGTAAAARTAGLETEQAQARIDTLGVASAGTARRVATLGDVTAATTREQRAAGTQATATATRLGRLGEGATAAARAQRQAAAASTAFATQVRVAAREVASAAAGVSRLGVSSTTMATEVRASGAVAETSLGRIGSAATGVFGRVKSLAGLLAGGALLFGGAALIKLGNESAQELNTFQATTGATAPQMLRAAAAAKQLGSDLSLPASTAKDAEEAMVDLAKAGFNADASIAADRAALTLQAGLHIKAADAAKYLGDTLDDFGLGANSAAHAADVLAGASTGASGGINDIWHAMKYAGPLAKSLHVSLEDTAAAVVALGRAGIIGQTAGTTLRTAFANMSKPTKQMQEGLDTLNISAFDGQGQFKGLTYVIGQLHAAQEKLSPKDFAAAVTKAYGKTGLSGMTALAEQGLVGFTAAQAQVTQVGKAQALTAAQSKGLTGAMTQLKTQAKQTGLTLYTAMSPALEKITRELTGGMASVTPWAAKAITYGTDLATLFGPELESKVHHGLGALADDAEKLIGPLEHIGESVAATGILLLVNAARTLETVLTNLEHGLEPIGSALTDVETGGNGAANALQIVVTAADLGLKAISGLSGVLVPAGKAVGVLVKAFSSLPSPVQTAIAAILLTSRIGPAIAASALSARTGLRNMSDEIRLTRMYANDAGQSMTTMGAAVRVLGSRVPVLSQMGQAFSAARVNASAFGGTVAGSLKAAGVGIKAAGAGLMGALGGPAGLALVGFTLGLGLLASHQQAAAAAAQAHEAAIENLSSALRDSNGAVSDNVRSTAAQILQDKKLADGKTRLVDLASTAGVSLAELTNAYTDQGDSVDQLRGRLDDLAASQQTTVILPGGKVDTVYYNSQAEAAHKLSGELKGMSGDFTKAQSDAMAFNDAAKSSASTSTAFGTLKNTVADLASATDDADQRTRDLKQALDLLSGGSISLQAAEARMNSAILSANSAVDSATKKTGGWGKALLQTNGAIDTTTVNGNQLYNSLSDVADGATNAAASAFTLAQNAGKTLPQSIAAATAEMSKGRKGAIDIAEKYGLTAKQAKGVADSMGLIPGQTSLILKTVGLPAAMADLVAIQAQFSAIPGTKHIVVDTLDANAQKELQQLGFTVKTLPGSRKIQINLDKATATKGLAAYLASVEAVPASKSTKLVVDDSEALNGARAVQNAVNSVHGKSITVTVKYNGVLEGYTGPKGSYTSANGYGYANGAVVDYFAGGSENHVAQITSKGGPIRVWSEPETAGEAYVPLSATKRGRSKAIVKEVVKRFGGVVAFANGGLSGGLRRVQHFDSGGFTYTPSDPADSAYSASDVLSAADPKSKGHVTLAQFERTLAASVKASAAWERNLSAIGAKAGGDVEDTLRSMGASGEGLVASLAKASKKQFASIVANLKALGPTAQATLADYTRQLSSANSTSASFQANLSKLASMGYGDLATQLAGQGDAAAQAVAAQAVKSSSSASKANAAAKKNAALLDSTQLGELVQIIAAVKTSSTGIHAVASATGLGEDEIIAVGDKARAQITSSLGKRGARFLGDLGKADKGLAYADGGIWEPGIYGAVPSGRIKFAEPSTQGEAYMPLAASKRAASTRVLTTVAGKFGIPLGTAHAAGGTVVIIQQAAPVIGQLTIPVTKSGASANEIAATVAWQARRSSRGGVKNR